MTIPPPDRTRLAKRPLPVDELPTATSLFRYHQAIHGPVFFGPKPPTPPSVRFHAPAHEFGVLYCSPTTAGAFVETFLRDVPVPGVKLADLQRYAVTQFTLTRALRLVDLHGPGMTKLGTTSGLAATLPYDVTWEWSLALWDHKDSVDGLLYRCRHDSDELAVALFNRADDALSATHVTRDATDPSELYPILTRYDVRLL